MTQDLNSTAEELINKFSSECIACGQCVEIIAMKNKGDKALCCGAYAIMGTGKPGHEFRKCRLDQAKGTGADILSLYCPGYQLNRSSNELS